MEFRKPTVSDLGKEGFRINYSKLKRTILKCELNDDKQECKKMLEEIGVKVYD